MIRCTVYERTRLENLDDEERPYRYTMLSARDYGHGSGVPVHEAPQVGDSFLMRGQDNSYKSYIVLRRNWLFTGYGSPAWPFHPYTALPPNGHECMLIVEECNGCFEDEAELTEAELEERRREEEDEGEG